MVQWQGRFSGLFGRKESREHSLLYVKGLLSNLERKSVGVANQWCGRVGKTTNCQVGVFLVGVTLPRGALGREDCRRVAAGRLACPEIARRRKGAAGVRVRRAPGVGDASQPPGTADLVGASPLAGQDAGGHESHRKSWLRKHKRIKPKVLL